MSSTSLSRFLYDILRVSTSTLYPNLKPSTDTSITSTSNFMASTRTPPNDMY
jgi:hypothetical protein